jgi:hypothetical protein
MGLSDDWEQVEIFVVFVFAALAKTDGFPGLNELDPLDPFDHLVAKLVLDPEPQRSPVFSVRGFPFISEASRHSALNTYARVTKFRLDLALQPADAES